LQISKEGVRGFANEIFKIQNFENSKFSKFDIDTEGVEVFCVRDNAEGVVATQRFRLLRCAQSQPNSLRSLNIFRLLRCAQSQLNSLRSLALITISDIKIEIHFGIVARVVSLYLCFHVNRLPASLKTLIFQLTNKLFFSNQ
jgi:hypothetical protein